MPYDRAAEDLRPQPFSRRALQVYRLLARRGGTMRMRPLLAAAGLAPDDLAQAIDELAERSWVKVTWLPPERRPPPDLPPPFREAERVTTTSFGRWRYPATREADESDEDDDAAAPF